MTVQIIQGLSRHLFERLAAVYIGGQPAKLYNAEGNVIVGGGSASAPVPPAITRQPSILPTQATVGDSVKLDIGAASGAPEPTVTWDITLNGVSIKDRIDQGTNTIELSAPGTHRLTASWSNSAGSVQAIAAELVVTAAAAINYDTALAYLDADTPFNGTADAVTGINMRGTGAFMLTTTGTGADIQRTEGGFSFADGVYLQTQMLSNQPTTDGLFAVVDVTLTSYGSGIGQILDGNGGHVKIRNNNGNLQVVGQDDEAVTVAAGSVAYGQRMVIAGQIDDVLDVVNAIGISGGDLSAPHGGLTDPALGRVIMGRNVNGTLHRLAIFARAEGGAWPVSMREVYTDFQRGE